MITYRIGNDLNLDDQNSGIGRELIVRTRDALGPRAMMVLLAAPAAAEYYPKLGFSRHGSAWILKAGDPITE